MSKVTVYPAKPSALKLRHPIDGLIRRAGGPWENDGFTARLLTERAITLDPKRTLPTSSPPAVSPRQASLQQAEAALDEAKAAVIIAEAAPMS